MVSSSFFPDPRPVHDDTDAVTPDLVGGWAGPPQHVIPGIADLVLELGRTDTTVVAVQGAEVFPAGVVLQLVVHVREGGREQQRRLFAGLSLNHGRGQLDLALPSGGLRWGVEMADGGRATSMDETPWNDLPDGMHPGEWQPDHPVMDGVGLPITEWGRWSRGIWLWPLPPLPSMRLVCAWPDRGIEETSVEVSTEGLHAAAARARPVW